MRKIKYVLVSLIALALIGGISLLPSCISRLMDRSAQGKSHLANIDTIRLNLDGDSTEASVMQKLALTGHGISAELTESQAVRTPEQIQQDITEKLRMYIDTGLFIGEDSSLKMQSCVPKLYYDANNAELHNIFWAVSMSSSSPNQTLEVLVDDHSGDIYSLEYFCDAQSAADHIAVTQAKAEQLAYSFFGLLNMEFQIENCSQTDEKTWYLAATCSENGQSIEVEFHYFGNGFSCNAA